MKIKRICYPTPLSTIKDIKNDNIDVFVEMENGFKLTFTVTTPNNLIWYMDKQNINYVDAGCPEIIVRSLTEENIREAIKSYASDDAYWLKLYFLANEFDVNTLDRMIKNIY